MANILQLLIDRICHAYLDEIIVVLKKRSEHIPDFRIVFDIIRYANLKLKPS